MALNHFSYHGLTLSVLETILGQTINCFLKIKHKKLSVKRVNNY